MKGATVRSVIVTALALATVMLLTVGCASPRGGTPELAAHAAGRTCSGVTVAGYWKSDIWTGPTLPDSPKDSVGHSLSLPATQVVKRNVRCGGGDSASCLERAINHFIEENKRHSLFLALPLLTTSVSHRVLSQKVKRKVTPSLHKAFAVSVFPALSLAACPGGSRASNGTTLNSARWCRPPP